LFCFGGGCAFGGQTLVGNRLLQQFVLLLGVDGGEMHAVVAAVAISFVPIGLRCQSETKLCESMCSFSKDKIS